MEKVTNNRTNRHGKLETIPQYLWAVLGNIGLVLLCTVSAMGVLWVIYYVVGSLD